MKIKAKKYLSMTSIIDRHENMFYILMGLIPIVILILMILFKSYILLALFMWFIISVVALILGSNTTEIRAFTWFLPFSISIMFAIFILSIFVKKDEPIFTSIMEERMYKLKRVKRKTKINKLKFWKR